MRTFTRADVISWKPCHGKTKTLRIMRGLLRVMTALDVLRHERATPQDRLWCVLRPEVLSDRTMRLFAAWCARTALEAERAAGREPDPRSWVAIDVAELYALRQASEAELCAARAAAYAAARAAAYAADAAAADAARAAAYAAYAATRAAQVARLIQIIEENEK